MPIPAIPLSCSAPTSIKYFPTTLIFSRSPPILSFISANQSATQKMNVPPARVHLFTFIALKIPCAMCMRPDGSKPSYRTKPGFLTSRLRRSASVTHSSPTERCTKPASHHRHSTTLSCPSHSARSSVTPFHGVRMCVFARAGDGGDWLPAGQSGPLGHPLR